MLTKFWAAALAGLLPIALGACNAANEVEDDDLLSTEEEARKASATVFVNYDDLNKFGLRTYGNLSPNAPGASLYTPDVRTLMANPRAVQQLKAWFPDIEGMERDLRTKIEQTPSKITYVGVTPDYIKAHPDLYNGKPFMQRVAKIRKEPAGDNTHRYVIVLSKINQANFQFNTAVYSEAKTVTGPAWSASANIKQFDVFKDKNNIGVLPSISIDVNKWELPAPQITHKLGAGPSGLEGSLTIAGRVNYRFTVHVALNLSAAVMNKTKGISPTYYVGKDFSSPTPVRLPPMMIGPVPLWATINPSIGLNCNFVANGSVKADFHFEGSAEVGIGGALEKGAWKNLSSAKTTFSPSAEISSLRVGTSLECAIGPEVALLLYDMAGPFINAKIYGKVVPHKDFIADKSPKVLSGNSLADVFRLGFRVEAGLKIDLDKVGISFLDPTVAAPLYDVVLWPRR